MVLYARTVYSDSIHLVDAVALSSNIVILAIFYCFMGALVSYILYYLFDEYDPPEQKGLEWEDKSGLYQFSDVSLEIAILSLVSFWLVFAFNTSAPIIPIPKHLAPFVDTYTTGMFFMYTIFIFMNGLNHKLMYIYELYLASTFNRIFPNKGSLLSLNLHYE